MQQSAELAIIIPYVCPVGREFSAHKICEIKRVLTWGSISVSEPFFYGVLAASASLADARERVFKRRIFPKRQNLLPKRKDALSKH